MPSPRADQTWESFTPDQRVAAVRNAHAQAAMMERGRARMALDYAAKWAHISVDLKRAPAADLVAQRAALCAELGVEAETALGCWDRLKQCNAATVENRVELSTKLRNIAAIDGALMHRAATEATP